MDSSVTENSDNSTPVAVISDYCPDWATVDGGVKVTVYVFAASIIKVLVTGPWYARGVAYGCLFDSALVEAEFVQPGVLKCFAPRKSSCL